MKDCEGCISIDNDWFPFKTDSNGKYIDQEGCGVDRSDELYITFCPVCGKKIKQKEY